MIASSKHLLSCDECEAEVILEHDMTDPIYRVEFCPFCGNMVDEQNVDFMGPH
jgi:hypothetical protein